MARILLVDDEDILRESLQKNLEAEHHEVICAANGLIAEQIFFASPLFDVVISDIRMPVMDGVQLLKSIRTQSQVPVILITGFSELLETQTAYELGANEFLPKPFSRQELIDAIDRCLHKKPSVPDVIEEPFCRLGIEDFISGREVKFNIFVRLGENKFGKVAQRGEDLSLERIRHFKEKGLHFLFLRREDFRKYVGLTGESTIAKGLDGEGRQAKAALMKEISRVLQEVVPHEGVDRHAFAGASAFVESTADLLTEDPMILDLLIKMKIHAAHLLPCSVGVAMYNVMLAHKVGWSLPTNRFKLAVGGLLHDIGQIRLEPVFLSKPRASWTAAEVKAYETHPTIGAGIAADLRGLPEDAVEITRQHHENCLGQGFPSLRPRTSIHPMAKLTAVSDEYCYRVIKNPSSAKLTPAQAAVAIVNECSGRLDRTFQAALLELLHVSGGSDTPAGSF